MFDYVRTQLSSNCITTSKKELVTKPAPQKAGFVFYLLAKTLNSTIEINALTIDATITAKTAMSCI
jgi:hypothetical protein